jgi:hypothetical protein
MARLEVWPILVQFLHQRTRIMQPIPLVPWIRGKERLAESQNQS